MTSRRRGRHPGSASKAARCAGAAATDAGGLSSGWGRGRQDRWGARPGRARPPRAVAGWGVPLDTSGHLSCTQASVSLYVQWIRVRGARAGAACVQTGQSHPESGIALLRPVSRFAGVGREGLCPGVGVPPPLRGFAKLGWPNYFVK